MKRRIYVWVTEMKQKEFLMSKQIAAYVMGYSLAVMLL